MSVAGFDVGSQASTVAIARKRGIDVLLNKVERLCCAVDRRASLVAYSPHEGLVTMMSVQPPCLLR